MLPRARIDQKRQRCESFKRMSAFPERDPPHPVKRREAIHATGHDVEPAIAVHVANSRRNQVRRLRGDAVRREALLAVVLQPKKARPLRVAPIVEQRRHDDVQLAFVVCVKEFTAIR